MVFGKPLLAEASRCQSLCQSLTVEELWPFSLTTEKNCDLGFASVNEKRYLAIPLARSCQYLMCVQILLKYPIWIERPMAISMFSLFCLGVVCTSEKWHLVIPFPRYYQYLCVCKILSK